jgi:receptor protein-tyrosine kinase
LRSALLLNSGGSLEAQPQVIVVCGPDRKSGKSLIASNLAILYAKTGANGSGRHVLLIDADLRTRSLTQAFGMSEQKGLSELLSNGLTTDCFGRAETALPVDFLPAGTPQSDTFEKLDSARTAQILREARKKYQVIVVDTPAISDAADAFVFAGLADVTLTVARNRKTPKGRLIRTISALARTDTKKLHLILNSVEEADLKVARRLG